VIVFLNKKTAGRRGKGTGGKFLQRTGATAIGVQGYSLKAGEERRNLVRQGAIAFLPPSSRENNEQEENGKNHRDKRERRQTLKRETFGGKEESGK